MARGWRIALWLARGQTPRLLPALAGLTLGLFLLVFFVALAEGLRRNVVEPVLGALPDEVQVTPSEERVQPGVTMQPMEVFSAEELERMSRLEGVAAVYPQVTSRFDTVIRISVGNPLGKVFGPKEFKEETKAFLAGVPAELVREELRLPAGRVDRAAPDPEAPWPFTWEKGQREVPILLSPLVATIWNTAFAEAFNLPRLSRDEWIGRELELVLGWQVELQGIIVGFSTRVDVVGAPVEMVEHYNQLLAPGRPSDPGRVHVQVEHPRHLATVVARLEEAGWYVTDEGETGRRVSRGLRIAEAALGLLGVVLVVTSLLNLSTVLLLSLRERRYELAVLRAYGAGRALIGAALALQTGLLGLVAGLIGLALAHLGAGVVNAAVLPLLEPALGDLGSLFHLTPTWMVVVLLGAPAAALLSAFPPAREAGRMNLAEVLRR